MKPEDLSDAAIRLSKTCHGDFRDGIISAPKSNLPGRRVSAAAAYLDKFARGRSRAVVREHTGLSHHVCGTCKIGSADDTNAVVDESGRVRGVEGLRIADASIFPVIPREGIHIPVLMAAEKMADYIKVNWCGQRHYSGSILEVRTR